jgi:hypothetical protein
MRRRDLGKAIVGMAIWPLVARAQQSTRMRRVGVLMPNIANDPQTKERNAAFLQGLQQLGWTVGQNIQIDYRWSGGTEDAIQKDAAELVSLAPDVIFALGSSAVGPLRRATRTVPIVFTAVADPVGAGFVESLARPGGNITGFTPYEYSIGGKWLDTYDAKQDVYVCPNGKLLRTSGTVHDSRVRNYLSQPQDCRACTVKQRCTRAPFKKIARDINEDARNHARSLKGTPEFEQSSNACKKVEMRFAHLKVQHGFERMRLRGLTGARDEFHLAAMVQNLKTLALRSLGPPTGRVCASIA